MVRMFTVTTTFPPRRPRPESRNAIRVFKQPRRSCHDADAVEQDFSQRPLSVESRHREQRFTDTKKVAIASFANTQGGLAFVAFERLKAIRGCGDDKAHHERRSNDLEHSRKDVGRRCTVELPHGEISTQLSKAEQKHDDREDPYSGPQATQIRIQDGFSNV